MKNTTEQFFAIVSPGFEQLCATELAKIVSAPLQIERGGIAFSGKLRELYSTNLWTRCASRILVRLETIKCRDFPTLFRKASRLPWGRFIKPGTPLHIRVTCHSSRLNHTDRIAATISEAIEKAIGSSGTVASPGELPAQQIFVRLDDDLCTLSIDSSGELLHRRGYRGQMTPAPLRETFAAGCLLHCGWHGGKDFCDLLCGSGTFAIEAALIAANRPPGGQRDFAFQHWPGYRQGLWQSLLIEARQQRREVTVTITAGDISAEAIAATRHNCESAEVIDLVTLRQQDYHDGAATAATGLWLSNPPYGERLKMAATPAQLLQELQEKFRDDFHDWQGGVILPQQTKSTTTPSLKFSNGGLDVALYPLAQ
ncbi:MAG: hypothetical protein J7K75_02355 [Desulfuromonas sp.]|nr:hypothetical protein [Desulfuromonas sp.]